MMTHLVLVEYGLKFYQGINIMVKWKVVVLVILYCVIVEG